MTSPDRIDFELSDTLKQAGIKRIGRSGIVIVVERNAGKTIVVTIKHDWSRMINDLRKRAEHHFEESIVNEIETVVTNNYEQVIGVASGDGKDAGAGQHAGNRAPRGGQKDSKEREVMKFSGEGSLWESIRLGDDYVFVALRDGKLEFRDQIDASVMTLRPYSSNAIDHFAFRNENELLYYLNQAKRESLDTLWEKVKRVVASFNDTDEINVNIIAADIIFSYFADRIGMTHYLFLAGPSGTGKGAILETVHQLGYRTVMISNATAANVYRLLGSVEKGQVTVLIDEANFIEDDPVLMETCKTGYKGNAKVPRISDASSSSAEQVFYNTFCFKIIAAEHLPAEWKAEGFLNRCFIIKTAPGIPRLQIDKVVENAGDPRLRKFNEQLSYVRNLLFAYRLLHFHEPIADVKLNIAGRDEELCSPLFRLFRNAAVLGTIKATLLEFIQQGKDMKNDALAGFVCKTVKDILDQAHKDEQARAGERGLDYVPDNTLPFSVIWSHLASYLDGETNQHKPQTMTTAAYGEVSYRRIAHILSGLGAKKSKNQSGSARTWIFDMQKLQRFSKSYARPTSIEIETRQNALDTSDTLWGEDPANPKPPEDTDPDADDSKKGDGRAEGEVS